jgi:hypothetical protein
VCRLFPLYVGPFYLFAEVLPLASIMFGKVIETLDYGTTEYKLLNLLPTLFPSPRTRVLSRPPARTHARQPTTTGGRCVLTRANVCVVCMVCVVRQKMSTQFSLNATFTERDLTHNESSDESEDESSVGSDRKALLTSSGAYPAQASARMSTARVALTTEVSPVVGRQAD